MDTKSAPLVAILGSCVTRDLFTHLPAVLVDVKLGPCVSRATLISMASPAPSELVGLLSAQPGRKFDDRRFISDVRKECFQVLARSQPQFLVIDLIDERHSTCLLSGGAVTLTKVSREFLAAHRIKGQSRTILPFSSDWQVLVESSIELVSGQLLQMLPQTRFVVHRALHCENYIDGALVLPFQESESILRWNRFLRVAYDHLAHRLSAISVQVGAAHTLAGGHHLWDRTPFHYDIAYYKDLWAQLRPIIQRVPS